MRGSLTNEVLPAWRQLTCRRDEKGQIVIGLKKEKET